MANNFITTDFIAELTFVTSEKGGRKTAVESGYRPHIEFEGYSEYKTSGQQTYLGQQIIYPGETVSAEISIIGTGYFVNKLHEGMAFKFCEGARIMGHGKILEIINVALMNKLIITNKVGLIY